MKCDDCIFMVHCTMLSKENFVKCLLESFENDVEPSSNESSNFVDASSDKDIDESQVCVFGVLLSIPHTGWVLLTGMRNCTYLLNWCIFETDTSHSLMNLTDHTLYKCGADSFILKFRIVLITIKVAQNAVLFNDCRPHIFLKYLIKRKQYIMKLINVYR